MRRFPACVTLAVAVFAQPAQAHMQADDTLPDAANVVMAYMTAQDWVAAFALPGEDDPAAVVPVGNATGVCAIVRRRGRVLGMGIDVQGDGLMLRRAVGRALSQVWTDDVVKRMPDSIRNGLGPELVLELEVAGPLIPLPGRTFDDAARKLEPGLDGIAMRRGERVNTRFPSQMLVSNLAGRVRGLLQGLSTDVGLGARPLNELRGQHGVSVYRFRTTHLGQTAPGKPPIELFRGNEIVYQSTPVDRARLVAIGESIAAHIKSHMWPGNEALGLMGDYLPTADRYEPIIALPTDQAFAAFALARFGHAAAADGDAMDRAARLDLARDILHALAERTDTEPDPSNDTLAAAMIVHAGLVNDMALAYRPAREMFERAVRSLIQSWDGERGFIRVVADEGGDADPQRALPPQQQAVCVSAITRLATTRGDQIEEAGLDLRAMIDRTWTQTPVEFSLNLLPWLAWAERDVADIGMEPTDATLNHLDSLALALVASQWSGSDADLSDCIGAFPVSGGGGSRAFDAQSLRPMAFLAMWARSPHASASAESRAAAERAVRYLEQLTLGDSAGWRYANTNRIRGGVCSATWDTRQPLAAQAMALLALAELLDAR